MEEQKSDGMNSAQQQKGKSYTTPLVIILALAVDAALLLALFNVLPAIRLTTASTITTTTPTTTVLQTIISTPAKSSSVFNNTNASAVPPVPLPL